MSFNRFFIIIIIKCTYILCECWAKASSNRCQRKVESVCDEEERRKPDAEGKKKQTSLNSLVFKCWEGRMPRSRILLDCQVRETRRRKRFSDAEGGGDYVVPGSILKKKKSWAYNDTHTHNKRERIGK